MASESKIRTLIADDEAPARARLRQLLKANSDFEVSAEIVVRKGPMDDADPLAFEAWALSDLLVNQVSPPK